MARLLSLLSTNNILGPGHLYVQPPCGNRVVPHFRFMAELFSQSAEPKERSAKDFVSVTFTRSGTTGHIIAVVGTNTHKTKAIGIKVRYYTKYPSNHERTPHFVTCVLEP